MKNREKELDQLSVRYTITEDPFFKEKNAENVEAIIQALSDVGVYMSVKDDQLTLSVMGHSYVRKKNRNAGRHKKLVSNPDAAESYEVWRYADIVHMMQTMNDKEICEKIGMAPATYYRHKRDLKNSEYFKSLDKNRLNDLEYLRSAGYNQAF